jgi:hypothetical protein
MCMIYLVGDRELKLTAKKLLDDNGLHRVNDCSEVAKRKEGQHERQSLSRGRETNCSELHNRRSSLGHERCRRQ